MHPVNLEEADRELGVVLKVVPVALIQPQMEVHRVDPG